MPKLSVFSFALLALSAVIVSPTFVQSASKKEKIQVLEEQINLLRNQEKSALKMIDERYDHVIRHLDPKEVHNQLDETLKVLRHVHEVLTDADFDYGGHKGAAMESVQAAEHQVNRALEHETAEERAKAAHDLNAAYADIDKALAYSAEKYGIGDNKKPVGQPETQVASDRQLAESLPKIGLAHHLLVAADHEIADYEQEKHNLREKRDAEKAATKEQYKTQIKPLEEEISRLKK